ncbi:MAG TPA: HEAT repeat domain-containing protein [Gemmataceae bacterium]|nr:HEAT repeat domain-containing protein [Gemmataceae bacterium]
MAITEFTCPECGVTARSAKELTAGTQVRCPKCSKVFKLPSSNGQQAPTKITTKSTVIAKPTANKPPAEDKPRRPRDDEENNRPKAARKLRDDRDDYDDDRPRKKKRKQEEKGSSAVLWIAGGVAGLVVLGAAVAIGVFAFGGKSDPTTEQFVARGPMATQPSRPPAGPPVNPSAAQPGMPATTSPPSTSSTKPEPVKEEPVSAPVTSGAAGSANDIYQYVLKSTTLMVNIMPNGAAIGTGFVVDTNERLVVTNYHVVANMQELIVFFPMYQDGKLVVEKERYMNLARERTKSSDDLIRGELLATDQQRDLALVRVPKIPRGTEALPIAKNLPEIGQTVHSVGNPGASGALWVYTQGVVKAVYRNKWRVRLGERDAPISMESEIVETQSPTNHGDSGGPLVNERGELVAVTEGGSMEGNLVSQFISLNETRDFVQYHFNRKFGKAWKPLVRAPMRARGGAGAVDVTKLINALDSRDAKDRASAAKTLGELGPDARLAIRRLVKALKDVDELTARAAAESLAKIGAPSRDDLPQLLEALKDPKIEVRRYAAVAIGQIGPDASSAAKDLVEALSDDDDRVREGLVRSLGSLGPNAKATAMPALINAFGDKDKEVRVATATAITNLLSSATADDVSTLLTVLKQKDPEASVFGARALAKLGKQAKAAIPDLMEACKSTDQNVRKEAIVALTAVGPDRKDKDPVPLYVATVKDSSSSPGVRQSALLGIAHYGKELDREKDKETIAAVVEAVKDSDKAVQKSALAAVAKLAPVLNNPTAVKTLIPQIMPTVMDYLQDQDTAQRDQALETIAGLGPAAKEAVPTLITMMEKADIKIYVDQTKQYHLKPEDEAFVDKIAKTIGKIGYGAVGSLLRGLDTSNVNAGLLIGSCRALGEIGPEAKKNQKTLLLLQAISDSNLPRPICVEADRALRKIRK